MKSPNLRSLLVAALAAAAGLTACKKPSTYVHVKILPAAAGEPAAISDVELDLDLAGKSTTLHLTDRSAPIQFPTDVTLEVKTGAGQLAITAICRNAAGDEVDRTTGTVQVASGAIAEAALQLPGGKPNLQPTEAQHDFNSVTAGQLSAGINISFHNVGFVVSGPASVALGGVGAAQFAIGADNCSGATVAAGASCAVSVVFQPVIAGPIAATLTISATPGGSAVVALTGTGVANPQNVSVTLQGTGQGAITSNPTGLTCGAANCTGTFDYGTAVTLTPVAATGSHFVSWGGACAGAGTCIASLTQARQATAKFDLDQELLTVVANGNGTIASGDALISCAGTGTGCSASYTYGSGVTLTATSGLGSHFTSWSDPTCGSVNPCALTLTAAATVTANFSLNLKNVTVTLSGNGNGTLVSAETPTPAIACSYATPNQSGTCTAQYAYGSVFTVNATPDSVSFFGGGTITGASSTCSATTNSCTVTVADTDIGLAINFTHDAQPLTVAIDATGTGAGSVNDAVTSFACTTGTCTDYVAYGASSVTLAAVPATGSAVTWGGVCAGAASSGNTCTLPGPITGPLGTATAAFNLVPQTLTVSTAGNGSGSVTCSDNGAAAGTCASSYSYGHTVTITATGAAPGSQFSSWSGCGSVASNVCTVTMTAPRSPTVTFTKVLEALTTATSGNGSGTPQCAVNGGSIGACATSYNYGDSVVITGTASTGSTFAGWSGDCTSTTGTCTLSMTSTHSVTAKFTLIAETLTVNTNGGNGTGSVLCSANGAAAVACATSYNYGTTLVLTATASSPSSTFSGWSGVCTNTTGNCSFTIAGSTTATAKFTLIPETLTLSTAGNGTGTFQCAVNGGTNGACATSYNYNDSVVVTATPGTGSNFTSWSGCSSTSTNTCSMTMTAARSGIATFTLQTESLIVNTNGGNGSGSVSCSVNGAAGGSCPASTNYGDSVVITATPATGSNFSSWSGCNSTSGAQCTLNMTSAKSATATFTLQTFTVTITGAGNGTGTITSSSSATLNCTTTAGTTSGTCTATVNYGASFQMGAAAAGSSNFSTWSDATCGTATSCNLTSITANKTVSATFALKTFTVSLAGGGNGTGTVTSNVGGISCTTTGGTLSGACSTTVNYGSGITLSEGPATGSNFTSWAGCTPSSGTCSIASIAANQSVTATFALQTFTLTIGRTGSGTVTSTDSLINCGTACTGTYNYGSSATLNAAATTGNLFVGWSACTGTGACTISNITSNQTVTANFPASFCAATITTGEAFGALMQGCPAKVAFPGSCGASAHVCSANEWVQQRGGAAPGHDYWTADALNYSVANGACGTSGCGPGSFFAGTGTTYTTNCGSTTPMRVCSGTAADPEGNNCNWGGGGYNSVTPNQYFGGCSGNTTAGTLCCSNALHQYFVSTSGLDTNAGTSGAPFKTLTHALSVAASGDSVNARPGTYDSTNGEAFPLMVPGGVNLIGDEPNRGAGGIPTLINGCALFSGKTQTISMGGGTTLAGFTITCGSGYAIVPTGGNTTIRNNSLNNTGIWNADIEVGSGHQVLLNSGTGNGYTPLNASLSAGSTIKVENNVFTGNGYGVEIGGAASAADLGGGAASSVGNNIFSCNTSTDVGLFTAGTVSALNDRWDHIATSFPAGPTVSATNGSGIDVYTASSGAISTAGATLAPSPCGVCASSATAAQVYDGTMLGCASSSRVTYSNRASMCTGNCHVCTSTDYLGHFGAIAPNLTYWLNDKIGDNGSEVGPAGSSFPNNCGNPAGDLSMLVVPDNANTAAGGSKVFVTGWGFQTTTNQHFGGCPNPNVDTTPEDGTLCCCP